MPPRRIVFFARALAKAAVRVAPEQDSTHASLTWDAAKKLEGFRGALDAERGGWDALARRFVQHAASIEPLHVVNYASALGWVRPLAEALADVPGGWDALTAALERHEDVVAAGGAEEIGLDGNCLLYTSPSPRDKRQSRMPSSA